MTLLLDATIKVSVILLCGLAAAAAAGRKSAAVRHWILSVAVICAIGAPLAGLFVPSWHIGLGRSAFAATTRAESDAPAAMQLSTGLQAAVDSRSNGGHPTEMVRRLLGPVWLAGAAANLLILLVGLGRLAWLAARSERVLAPKWTVAADDISIEYGLVRPVLLLQSDHPTLLVTWGARRPKVILPRPACTWSDARIRVVLCHELAHVRRRDWLPQMTAELLRSIHWFNPLVWIACRRLRDESEHACDDVVIGAGVERSAYAAELLDLARAAAKQDTTWSPALAIARPSTLEGRIRAMLNVSLNRKPLTRSTGVLIALACLAVAVPVTGFATSSAPAATAAVAMRQSVAPPIKVVRRSVLDRGDQEVWKSRLDPTVGGVAGTTLAQVAFASFSGTIVDPSGGLLPGVTLSLVNGQTQAKQEVHSDRRGHFEFVGLPAGSYALAVLLPGFATLHQGVSLSPGQVVEQNLQMQIGSIQETVMVTDRDAYPPDYGTQRREIDDRLETLTARTRVQAGGSTCDAPVAGGIGGNIKAPRRVNNVRPVYPPAARDGKIEGTVVLQGRIDTSGFVTDVRVLGSPQADLAAAATEAVNGWRFDATLLNCVPIETMMGVTVNFQLAR
jgi:TonB family protein